MRPPEDEVLLRDMLDAARRAVAAVADAPHIPWREIVGMRNRLVHGYASVDHDIVWDVIAGDLPKVITSLEALLAEDPTDQ